MLGMFENSVMKEMYGLKKYDVKGDWRKVHNEELIDL
jgi:hypothetical protein